MPGIGLRLSLLALLACLAACGWPKESPVPIAYEPTAPISARADRPVVAMGAVFDQRRVPPHWLGKASDKLGLHDETLVSEPPVARAVRMAFADALMTRGLLAPPGRSKYDLTVRIRRLDAKQRWRRHAIADLAITLTRRNGGPIVYTDEVAVIGRSTGPFSLGAGAYVPVADVSELEQGAMNRAIDLVLDKPGFRAALRR